MGAAYGTAKSGVGIASMGVMRPELVMKSIVPVVMAGVLGIYGLIIAVIISTGGEACLGTHRAGQEASRRSWGFWHSSSLPSLFCAASNCCRSCACLRGVMQP